jgi:divalent metal cation (Fe/Co/Zn/Cd) transporter
MTKTTYTKALKLEYFTVGYNIVEGIFSVIIGYLSGSIALVGFGFDSAVESISGGVLIWRLKKHGKIGIEEEERIERKTVKLVGYSFFILGAYVFIEAVKKLYFQEIPEPTIAGIIIAALSLIIMPILAKKKFKTAKEINSASLAADSKQTLICAYLSLALLIGLGLNYLFGLWWADPFSALVIVALIIKEGFDTLKEGKLCNC